MHVSSHSCHPFHFKIHLNNNLEPLKHIQSFLQGPVPCCLLGTLHKVWGQAAGEGGSLDALSTAASAAVKWIGRAREGAGTGWGGENVGKSNSPQPGVCSAASPRVASFAIPPGPWGHCCCNARKTSKLQNNCASYTEPTANIGTAVLQILKRKRLPGDFVSFFADVSPQGTWG